MVPGFTLSRWGTLAEVLNGPSRVPDGTMNLVGGLRQAMATTGYSEVKEFQRIELTIRLTVPPRRMLFR